MRSFCSLLSGGKDSNYALYKALREGMEASCILVVSPSRKDSWMFHTPYTNLAELQVESMGLLSKLVKVPVSGIKEKEVEELAEVIKREWKNRGFDTLVVGALASRYQFNRIKRIADELGLEIYAPGWGMDPEDYMRTLISEGLKFIIIKISVMGLPKKFLGIPINKEHIEEIIQLSRKYGFHPAFEGGEAETLTVDAPHYKKKICITAERKTESIYIYYLDIKKAKLADKRETRCIQVDNETYP